MHFTKYHGLGNDFVLLSPGPDAERAMTPERARALCRRGFGVGADGLMTSRATAAADLEMVLLNSDGSVPEMCGNGIRCFVKWAVDVLGERANPLRVLTPAGVMACAWRLGDDGLVATVRVDMGRPRFERAAVPVLGSGDAIGVEVTVDDRVFTATGVNTGNPHMVIFGEASRALAAAWGPHLTAHALWPEGANVEFVSHAGGDHLNVIVWERGCGLTEACGTGATAAAAAAVRHGLVPFERPIRVSLPGGDLTITIRGSVEDGMTTAWMEGPATCVYEGNLG